MVETPTPKMVLPAAGWFGSSPGKAVVGTRKVRKEPHVQQL